MAAHSSRLVVHNGRMAFIRLVPDGEATGKLRELYDQAIARAGRVYNIVRTMSPNPAVMEASMALYMRVMKGPSGLTRREREMLATVVSTTNDCFY
jgi:alkylhydroperoxidase family enzyme